VPCGRWRTLPTAGQGEHLPVTDLLAGMLAAPLDQEALGALGMVFGTGAPALPMRVVPKKPRFRDVATKDHFRMTPAAKKVLEDAVRPNRRKLQVTAQQVLAQILTLQLGIGAYQGDGQSLEDRR
jgi:hypothetical protein